MHMEYSNVFKCWNNYIEETKECPERKLYAPGCMDPLQLRSARHSAVNLLYCLYIRKVCIQYREPKQLGYHLIRPLCFDHHTSKQSWTYTLTWIRRVATSSFSQNRKQKPIYLQRIFDLCQWGLVGFHELCNEVSVDSPQSCKLPVLLGT